MAAKGARYKWKEGKILHASRFYRAPTMRRIPRILIEDRALEVAILLHIEEPWMIYEETSLAADSLSTKDALQLIFYFNRYHLVPEKFLRQDTHDWLKKPRNYLLLWGKDNRYYIKRHSK